MLYLVFQLGSDRYALQTGHIAEVLPMLAVKAIPLAAPGICGVINYHGTPVPLIDLAALALGRPSEARMSTRILMVSCSLGGEARLLGLLAEHATEVVRRSEEDFADPGVTVAEARYLGPVAVDERGILQRLEPDELLTEEVRVQLFQQLEEAFPLHCELEGAS